MKLYLRGHDYKYAAGQMLLMPHGMSHPAGTPLDLNLSPGGSESRPAPRRSAREGQQQDGRRFP